MPANASAKILRGTTRNLALLSRVLARGGVVAVPTETVYGLAGDALNVRACKKIFEAKGRPSHDPLIVHIASLSQLDVLAERSPAATRLAKVFWPGPLTLVLPKKNVVPDIVTSGKTSVALRMPRHRLFRALLKRCGKPLAAPSANPFGYISPTTAAHVMDGLGKCISYILDGGPCGIGVESTIVDLRDPARPAILRPGGISAAQISKVLGRSVAPATKAKSTSLAEAAAIAPGMLARHYSPRTAVVLHRRLTAKRAQRVPQDEACVFLYRPAQRGSASLAKNVFWLAEKPQGLAGVARHLFARLRTLDQAAWKAIHIELAPGRDGLAAAINDRLRRAAAQG